MGKIIFYLLFIAGIPLSCKEDPVLQTPICGEAISNLRTLKITSTSNIPSTPTVLTSEYVYKNDKIISSTDKADSVLVIYYTYTYNDKGLLIDITGVDPDNNFARKFTYEYNSNNKVSKQTQYFNNNGQQELFCFKVYGYDANCNPVKETRYNSQSQIEQILVFETIAQNISKISYYDCNNELFQIDQLQYDNNNHIRLTPNFQVFDYCKNNLLRKDIVTFLGGSTTTHSFETYNYIFNNNEYPHLITHKVGNLGEYYDTIEYK